MAEHPFEHQNAHGCETGGGADEEPPPRKVGVPPGQHQRRHHPTEHEHGGDVGGCLHGVERISTVPKDRKTTHEFHFKRRIVHDSVAGRRHPTSGFDPSGFNDALRCPVLP